MIGTSSQPDNEPASWRCFIAVEISDEVRENAARLQSKLRRTDADVSFPDPANMHLTVVFLGDTLTGKIEPLKVAIDAAAATVAPFDMNYSGLGFFGAPHHPRVIWAGVGEPCPGIHALFESLLEKITELEFTLENRAFRPHLTLGRIRSARGLAGLTAMAESLKDSALGCSHVERVVLMRSHLDRPKASYEILHEAKLTGA